MNITRIYEKPKPHLRVLPNSYVARKNVDDEEIWFLGGRWRLGG